MIPQHIIDSPDSIQSQIIQEKLKYYRALFNNEQLEVRKKITKRIRYLEAILYQLLSRE